MGYWVFFSLNPGLPFPRLCSDLWVKKKDGGLPGIGKEVEQLEITYIIDGSINWPDQFRIYFGTIN